MFVDRACAFGGDLIVVTGEDAFQGGDVWRVKVDGTATKLATICQPGTSGATCAPVHLEGVITLPNTPQKYGPWAGTVIAGDENDTGVLTKHGRVWSITSGGVATPYDLSFTDGNGLTHPMKTEDLDLIESGQNFFGVNYNNARILTAAQSDLAPFVGDVLLTQEYPCGTVAVGSQCPGQIAGTHTSGLYAVRFVGSGGNAAGGIFNVTPFTLTGSSVSNIDQWEHVTLAPLGTPHLKITKNPKGATLNIGDPLSFTIVVTSDGEGTAHNVVLNDPLPTTGGLTWAVTSVTPNLPCSINGSQVLHCTLGDLAKGTAVTVVVTTNNVGGAPPAACTRQPNVATTQADDTVPVQDTGDYTCLPPAPGVTIIKFTNGQDANDPNAAGVPNVPAGGAVTWTYKVTNTGQTSPARVDVHVTDNVTGVAPTFTSELSGNGDTIFNPGEVWLYSATGTALDLTLPPPAGTHTVANSCTASGTQPPRTAYTNIGTVTIPGASATDPSSYCNPPPGKTFSIGPSSMEGAIKISNGDWVNGGYSFQTNFNGTITVAAQVSITGACSTGGTGVLVVPLGTKTYDVTKNSSWIPTGDANSVLSWQGAIMAAGICGGAPAATLDASRGAVFTSTVSGAPNGGKVTWRFKFRDPAAKGKPNTNCLDTSDPNRNKADVCGASWSETKTDP